MDVGNDSCRDTEILTRDPSHQRELNRLSSTPMDDQRLLLHVQMVLGFMYGMIPRDVHNHLG